MFTTAGVAAVSGRKSASIHYYFPTKAALGASVARRYREDAAAVLDAMAVSGTPLDSLRDYPATFRRSLESDNRLCLGSLMAAEYEDLPEAVKQEVQAFTDGNVALLGATLASAGVSSPADGEARARAIFAAIAGAQLVARSRADIGLFDTLIDSYRAAGLLPA